MDEQQQSPISEEAWRQRAAELTALAQRASLDGIDQEAYKHYDECLEIYRRLGDKKSVLLTLLRLFYLAGWADFGDGLDMFQRGHKIITEAYVIAQELDDKALSATTLIAGSRFAGTQSAAVLEEALKLAREAGNRRIEARALERLAKHASTQEKPHRKMEMYRQALEIFREIDDKSSMASVLFSMAIHSRGPRRLECLEMCAVAARECGDKKQLFHALTMLWNAVPESDQGRVEAIALEALELARFANNPIRIAMCLRTLAKIARNRGENSHAEELVAEANVIDPPDPAMEADFAAMNAKLDELMAEAKRQGVSFEFYEAENEDAEDA